MKNFEELTFEQHELWLYMTNTESIYRAYHSISEDVVERREFSIFTQEYRRAENIARDAAGMYRREIGDAIKGLNCAQIAEVGRMILEEDAKDTWNYKHIKIENYDN